MAEPGAKKEFLDNTFATSPDDEAVLDYIKGKEKLTPAARRRLERIMEEGRYGSPDDDIR